MHTFTRIVYLTTHFILINHFVNVGDAAVIANTTMTVIAVYTNTYAERIHLKLCKRAAVFTYL